MTSPDRTRTTLAAAACLALLLAVTPTVAADSADSPDSFDSPDSAAPADSTDAAALVSPGAIVQTDASRALIIECIKDRPPGNKILGVHVAASMSEVGVGTGPSTGATLFPSECLTAFA